MAVGPVMKRYLVLLAWGFVVLAGALVGGGMPYTISWFHGTPEPTLTASSREVGEPGPAPGCKLTDATYSAKIWPLPRCLSFQSPGVKVNLAPDFFFAANNAFLDPTLAHYRRTIFQQRLPKAPTAGTLKSLVILVKEANTSLVLGTSEEYTLQIKADGAHIWAETVYGAIRGLETFSQLVSFDYDQKAYTVSNVPWVIHDYPRFVHRGLLLDSSRHFLPVPILKRVFDGMCALKLNVLHWHVIDAHAFPIEIKRYPKLWQGAWSPGERYTQEDLEDLVEYAKQRAIRVIVEIDGPGHGLAWGVGYPELIPENYDNSGCRFTNCPPKLIGRPTNGCNVPLDPTSKMLYEVVEAIMTETSGKGPGEGIFPDNIIHIGGDEVETCMWEKSPKTGKQLKEMGLNNWSDLYWHYIKTVSDMAFERGRDVVVWEEVLTHFKGKLDKRAIIDVWMCCHYNVPTPSKVVEALQAGYRAILSDPTYSMPDWDHLWDMPYIYEPMTGVPEELGHLLLGGEVNCWGEMIDGSNIEAAIFPRGAAVAERLWSAREHIEDKNKAVPRLQWLRCLLLKRGIPSIPWNSYGMKHPGGPGGCAQDGYGGPPGNN